MARKEKDFQKELIDSLRLDSWTADKFPDMPRSSNTRFIPEKPADIVGADDNALYVLIECKFANKVKKLSLKDFQPSQIKALTQVSSRYGAGHAYAVYCLHAPLYKGSKKKEHIAFIFEWSEWLPRIKKGIGAAELHLLIRTRNEVKNDGVVMTPSRTTDKNLYWPFVVETDKRNSNRSIY